MTGPLAEAGATAFLVFCRFGACLMLLPGFASARVVPQLRVLTAFAVSLVVTPLVYDQVAATTRMDAAGLGGAIAGEVLSGGFTGLLARLQLLGLHFAASFAAGTIGLQGMPGQPVDDTDATPPLATLVSMAATIMLFAAGLHLEVLRGLILSYQTLPVGSLLDSGWLLRHLLQVTSDSTFLAARIAGPFAVYSLVVNLAIGLAGKFAPQVSLYFASLGLVTMGGLLLFYFLAPAWLALFVDGFGGWIAGGGS